MSPRISRRKTLQLFAATAATAFIPPSLSKARSPILYQEWTGRLMGLEASLKIFHPDPELGKKLIQETVSLVRRGRKKFSIYDPHSLVSRLNETGELISPPLIFFHLLSYAQNISQRTNGRFDITVEPLKRFYQDYFKTGFYRSFPTDQEISAIRSSTGYHHLNLKPDHISFNKPGMAISLNGLAQGYITDQAANFLKNAGLKNVLVDFGELRALGSRPENRPWNIAITDPDQPFHITSSVPLREESLATSGGYGEYYNAGGTSTHLIDPTTGVSPKMYKTLSVQAATALDADAWSTAFYMMDLEEIHRTLATQKKMKLRLTEADGRSLVLKTPDYS